MTNDMKNYGISTDTIKDYSTWGIISRLLSYLKPYRKKVIVALMLSIISSMLFVVRPYLIKVAIDDYLTVGNLNGLKIFLIVFIIIYFLRFFTGYFLNMITKQLWYFGRHNHCYVFS